MKTLRVKATNIAIRERYEEGSITLKEAAREFCRLGWTNFVDESAAMKFMMN